MLDDTKILEDQVDGVGFTIKPESNRENPAVQIEIKKSELGDPAQDEIGDQCDKERRCQIQGGADQGGFKAHANCQLE